MNKLWMRCAIAFGAAAAVTTVLVAARTAVAKTYRVSAATCLPENPVYLSMYDDALTNMDTSHLLDVDCAVPDGDYLAHDQIAYLNVHGYNGSNVTTGTTGWAMAEACVGFYASNSGSCGSIASTGAPNTGMFTLQPSLTAWQNPSYHSDFAYVWSRIPPRGTGARSNLRGIWMSN
ncbi:MAG: hypothetical protein ABUL62_25230 [Myxococcales bacterium]